MAKKFVWTPAEAACIARHVVQGEAARRESLKQLPPPPSPDLKPLTEMDQLKEAVRQLERRVQRLEKNP